MTKKKVEKAEPEKKDNTIHISQEEAATLTKDEILAKANKDKAEETESAEGSEKEEEKENVSSKQQDPFFVRFRLRVIFQNVSNYAVLLVGILFANLLLMFGLALPAVAGSLPECAERQSSE